MDSAKRQRREQVLRYYAREKELEEVENESLRSGTRQPVIIISESARLKDAAINRGLEEISYILKHHSSILSKEDINVAFLQACINGHEDVARLLLDQGASVDYQDTDNWTGAHFASAHGHSSILHLLFEFGADVTLLDADGNFALDYSENATVRKIIEEEMAQSGVYTEDLSSLRTRQLKAMTAAVRNALLKGKDLTLPNKNGVTPLHTAAAYGYHEVVQLLVESGSIPLSILDESGCTPLYLAMKYNQTQIAKYLLDSGAKMEASSSKFKRSLAKPTEMAQSPLPSNEWKLKRPSVDDAMREKHFISQYIGLVQDSSTGEGTLLDDANVPFSEIPPGASDPVTRSCIPSTIDNEQQGLGGNEGNYYSESSISEKVQRKSSTPLQPIPEMIYDTCPKLASPTKTTPPLVVEDIYDVPDLPLKPKTKSIYDDDFSLSGFHGDSGHVTPRNKAYNLEADNVYSLTPLMKQLVPSRDQDYTPRSVSPSPYETFVSIHSNKLTTPSPTTPTPITPTSAPPIPIRRIKDKKNSEPIIPFKQTSSKKQRSISVDNSIGAVGSWLQNMHKKKSSVAPLVLPNVKKPAAPKSPVLPPRRMELGQLSPAHSKSPVTPIPSPSHSTSSSPIHLSVQPRARPSSLSPVPLSPVPLSPVPLSPNYDADPPPSYATVFHSPEQFPIPGRADSPSPPPVPPHPSHWVVRPQIHQRSEPANIGFRRPNLRRIVSGPLDDRKIPLFGSGSDSSLDEAEDGVEIVRVVKPYTFKTMFQ